jgi:hypothetical protein
MNILTAYASGNIEILGHINKKATAEKFLDNLRKCSKELSRLNAKTFYRELTDENEIKESYEKIYEKYSKSVVKICQEYPNVFFDIIPTKELKE